MKYIGASGVLWWRSDIRMRTRRLRIDLPFAEIETCSLSEIIVMKFDQFFRLKLLERLLK